MSISSYQVDYSTLKDDKPQQYAIHKIISKEDDLSTQSKGWVPLFGGFTVLVVKHAYCGWVRSEWPIGRWKVNT